MELRKLEQREHAATRPLWEEVFSEDTKAFLDYYYFFKARENEIYVIEEDKEIRSMLHLNPYLLQMGETTVCGHYIVGVATQEAYRKRGYMGELLRRSMQELYKRKEPFTFLMPAAERIYTPYDFRFVYRQEQRELRKGEKWIRQAAAREEDAALPDEIGRTRKGAEDFGENKKWMEAPELPGKRTVGIREVLQRFSCFSEENTGQVTEFSDAALGDAGEIAEFVQRHFAGQWQVHTVRNEEYYQTLLFEQQSENGGIRLMRNGGTLTGVFAYAEEDEPEIREPLYVREAQAAFYGMLDHLLRSGKEPLKIYGWEEEDSWQEQEYALCFQKKREPLMMVRILHLESLLSCMKVRQGEELDCSFAVLDSILPQNSRIWRLQGGGETDGKVQVRETEDSDGVLTIGALTSLLFGYRTAEEIAGEEHVILPEQLAEELAKLQTWDRVYLNEVV